MIEYLKEGGEKYPGKVPTNLPSILNQDLEQMKSTIELDHSYSKQNSCRKMTNLNDLQKLRELAQERENWRKEFVGQNNVTVSNQQPSDIAEGFN